MDQAARGKAVAGSLKRVSANAGDPETTLNRIRIPVANCRNGAAILPEYRGLKWGVFGS